ncbi:hypothetical protein [Streptomyces sp. NPDC002676]
MTDAGCTCPTPWPALITVVEERCYTVVPAAAHTPASALYLARCAGCGARYTGPWRRLGATSRARPSRLAQD